MLAHAGEPVAPHDVWAAWNLDPVVLLGIAVAVVLYRRGQIGGRRRPADTWRARCFAGAMVALAIALVSPLDAMSGSLASAHMAQHILLVLVAAPLLALSAPSSALLRGTPLGVRQSSGRWRRRLRLSGRRLRVLRHPGVVWLLHVGTLWFWHAALPYDSALANPVVHVVEHGAFLLTGVLFWRVVAGARGAGRVSPGLGVLLVFGMAMQSVFLSLLLTFARDGWYRGYASTTAAWGMTPLADQQLAGVLMWIPAGVVYLAAGLTLLVSWVRATEDVSPAQ